MKISFPPIVNPDCKILLLGTMPGERSLAVNEYYGHANNHFWKILFTFYKTPFSKNYNLKTNLLLQNNIALWDVLQCCESENSADSSIKNEVANDFNNFYKNYPLIKSVFFTSKAAEMYYDKYVKKSNDKIYLTLPSPSRANTWKSFEEKLLDWKSILNQT